MHFYIGVSELVIHPLGVCLEACHIMEGPLGFVGLGSTGGGLIVGWTINQLLDREFTGGLVGWELAGAYWMGDPPGLVGREIYCIDEIHY